MNSVFLWVLVGLAVVISLFLLFELFRIKRRQSSVTMNKLIFLSVFLIYFVLLWSLQEVLLRVYGVIQFNELDIIALVFIVVPLFIVILFTMGALKDFVKEFGFELPPFEKKKEDDEV